MNVKVNHMGSYGLSEYLQLGAEIGRSQRHLHEAAERGEWITNEVNN